MKCLAKQKLRAYHKSAVKVLCEQIRIFVQVSPNKKLLNTFYGEDSIIYKTSFWCSSFLKLFIIKSQFSSYLMGVKGFLFGHYMNCS